jgi:hypothetical protein
MVDIAKLNFGLPSGVSDNIRDAVERLKVTDLSKTTGARKLPMRSAK